MVLLAHQRAFEEHRPSQPFCEHLLALLQSQVLLLLDAAGKRWWHRGDHGFLGDCYHSCEPVAFQLKAVSGVWVPPRQVRVVLVLLGHAWRMLKAPDEVFS